MSTSTIRFYFLAFFLLNNLFLVFFLITKIRKRVLYPLFLKYELIKVQYLLNLKNTKLQRDFIAFLKKNLIVLFSLS